MSNHSHISAILRPRFFRLIKQSSSIICQWSWLQTPEFPAPITPCDLILRKVYARKWTRLATQLFNFCAGIKVSTRIIKLYHQMVLGQQRRPHLVWQIEFLIVQQASLSYPKVICLELRWQTAFLVSDSYDIFQHVPSVCSLYQNSAKVPITAYTTQ